MEGKRTPNGNSKGPHDARMWEVISAFTKALGELPGWREWQRNKIRQTLFFDDVMPGEELPPLLDFPLPPRMEKEHAVIIKFLTLGQTVTALKQCEYYFRRYPFRGLPVDRHDHIRNVCELYFSRFYQFREHLKNTLNAAQDLMHPKLIEIGKLLKQFDRDFDQEIRARHNIHHHDQFEDIEITRIFFRQAMAKGGDDNLKSVRLGEYRRAANHWAKRVRDQGAVIDKYFEAVAECIVENCDFSRPST